MFIAKILSLQTIIKSQKYLFSNPFQIFEKCFDLRAEQKWRMDHSPIAEIDAVEPQSMPGSDPPIVLRYSILLQSSSTHPRDAIALPNNAKHETLLALSNTISFDTLQR